MEEIEIIFKDFKRIFSEKDIEDIEFEDPVDWEERDRELTLDEKLYIN